VKNPETGRRPRSVVFRVFQFVVNKKPDRPALLRGSSGSAVPAPRSDYVWCGVTSFAFDVP
jgi:hypothetical protein